MTLTKEDMKGSLGGDFWNKSKLARQVFERFPDAEVAEVPYMGTGLWCDVIVNGESYRFYAN